MTRRGIVLVVLVILFLCAGDAQEFHEQYSARVGFYAPNPGLNNGFILGADGSLDFPDYRLILNFSGDCYIKQTFNFFSDPKPEIVRQQILLVPVAIGLSYHLMGTSSEGIVISLGVAGGYYFDFYDLDYRNPLAASPLPRTQSDSKTGGNFYSALVARLALDNFFVEPKLLFAKSHRDVIRPYSYEINPSGFIITVGFQY